MTAPESSPSSPVVHKFIYRQRAGERTTLCAQDDGVQTAVSTDRTRVTCPKCTLLMTENVQEPRS